MSDAKTIQERINRAAVGRNQEDDQLRRSLETAVRRHYFGDIPDDALNWLERFCAMASMERRIEAALNDIDAAEALMQQVQVESRMAVNAARKVVEEIKNHDGDLLCNGVVG